MPIDEFEFRRILNLFPVVRSGDVYLDTESSSQSTSSSKVNEYEGQDRLNNVDRKYADSQGSDRGDAFWAKLKSLVEKKMGPSEAEKFCQGFQKVYRRLVRIIITLFPKFLVYEELSLDSARSFINSSENSHS
ncbi:hypothetical protein M9H77_17607 [Catharanthus roseus]|uniref:Uncharacterized protein n=1 Tax=Catharanthus roseus TaxID=4058 RepID=A0ACC0B529_CATRO|nr:hypothetical protein M9H77_17607 [Catharanthus roseus]